MPTAKLTQEQWAEIQKASEAGIDDETLSMDYGVTKTSIKVRRCREKWLTPQRVHAEVVAQQAKRRALNPSVLPETAETGKPAIPASEAVAAKILETLERNSLRISQMADSALREMADKPPEIKFWSDVTAAYKLLRLAAGADKDGKGANVTINLGAIFNAPATVVRNTDDDGCPAQKPDNGKDEAGFHDVEFEVEQVDPHSDNAE